MEEFYAQAVANTLWALGKLEVKDADLIVALGRRAQEVATAWDGDKKV